RTWASGTRCGRARRSTPGRRRGGPGSSRTPSHDPSRDPVSINISQIYVRYPDEKDVATLLATQQDRTPGSPSYLVTRTGTPWLAVFSGDNSPSPEKARYLSRALEGVAIWFGLAGNALAYRIIRYDLGRESEKILEPAEIFGGEAATTMMPAYKDVEAELYG